MKYFSMLIKPASSSCNMCCKYCFYNDVSTCRETFNYGIMSQETMQACIDLPFNYFQEETQITFLFQGGEPTCAGLDYFKEFIKYVDQKKQSYHQVFYGIQTNGTLLTEEWIQFFKQNSFLVGISLDGYQENHDSIRLDSAYKGTYQKIVDVIKQLKKEQVEFNVLTVLTSQLAKDPERLFRFYLGNDLNYIQLIPCLPPFEEQDEYGLKPEEFFSFYDKLFPLWKEELEKNQQISINFFDNVIPLFVGIPPQQCGFLGYCTMQFVVESDGSVYPCDFYVLDQYKLGNVKANSILELSKSSILKQFLKEEKRKCSLCECCRYLKICNGQCKRMNLCYYNESYCGYQAFLMKHESSIMEIASKIRR